MILFFNLNSARFLLCLTPLCDMIDVLRVSLLPPTLIWYGTQSLSVSEATSASLVVAGAQTLSLGGDSLLHDSFPGCQLSLLFSFQHAWLLWSGGGTLLCLEAVLSGGKYFQELCRPCFPSCGWRSIHVRMLFVVSRFFKKPPLLN